MQFLILVLLSFASSDDLDLIWTSTGCDYVPTNQVRECKRLVRQGRPFKPRPGDTASVADAKAASNETPIRTMGDVAFGTEVGVSLGYAMAGGVGGSFGVAAIWPRFSAHATASLNIGTEEGKTPAGYKIDANGSCHDRAGRFTQKDDCSPVDMVYAGGLDMALLAGRHDVNGFLFGGGWRFGYPFTPFASAAYVSPESLGFLFVDARVGYQLAMISFVWSFSPEGGSPHSSPRTFRTMN